MNAMTPYFPLLNTNKFVSNTSELEIGYWKGKLEHV